MTISDGLAPDLGPIASTRVALDLAMSALTADPTRLRRLDGADPEILALIGSLARLCAVLAQLATPSDDSTLLHAEALLDVLRAHAEMRNDLEQM